MNPDFSELLQVFNENHVKYLIIGGYAVIQYTEPRYTKDLDLWVDSDIENARRVFESLAVYGAPIEKFKVEDFTDEGAFFTMGLPPNRIDIWFALEGVDTQGAWERRVEGPLDEITVNFIGREDLILNKTAVGRLQDLADAEKLRDTATEK